MGMGPVIDPDIWPMQEGINEVIATTRMNAAPMGIICRDNQLMMAVYRSSHTASRIEEGSCVVANIIHDPVVFVQTAFGDLPEEDFIAGTAGDIRYWRLKDAGSWVVYHTRIEKKTDLKLLVSLTPVYSSLMDSPQLPVNRGLNSVIEATVHATRFVISHDPELKRLIDHHVDLIRRCGGRREYEALSLLLSYISSVTGCPG